MSAKSVSELLLNDVTTSFLYWDVRTVEDWDDLREVLRGGGVEEIVEVIVYGPWDGSTRDPGFIYLADEGYTGSFRSDVRTGPVGTKYRVQIWVPREEVAGGE